MNYDPADFRAFQELYESVSKFPELATSHDEFLAALRAHTPSCTGGAAPARVLLSIAIDADGAVETARAVQPSPPPGVRAIAIHTDGSGNVIGGAAPITEDEMIVAAAEAIGRSLRFRPAERHGQPVAFPDFRMSIEFGGKPAGE